MLSLVKLNRFLARISLRNRLCYSAAKKILKTNSETTLPTIDEAKKILNNASPRPEKSLWPIHRNWPENPTVDISIIVPCFNVEKYINECINSCLAQKTSKTFEIIAINDGSTDNTGLLLNEIASKAPRLKVIHQNNRGFSGARNRGIDSASGRTFVFCDSDDIMEPDAIEKMYKQYESSDCDFVSANFIEMSEDGQLHKKAEGQRTHGGPCARLYSREIWRNLRFPENFWFEDTVQAYCIDQIYREAYCDHYVYRYRQHKKSITHTASFSKKGLDSFYIVDEMLEWCKNLSIALDQKLYDQTLRQFGPILFSRCASLEQKEWKALFVCIRQLIKETPWNNTFQTNMVGHWKDLEYAIQTNNYYLWQVAMISLLS